MDNLQQVFIDEATEMLQTLEMSLLQLETNPADPDGIGKVFRVMHTVKGSSGMFGYDAISTLTHQLETIFESIREGQSHLTQDILRVTFQSLDHLNQLLVDPQMKNDVLLRNQEILLKEIAIVGKEGEINGLEAPVENSESKPAIYYISFSPSSNLLRNGNNPLFLVEDILALGSGAAFPNLGEVPEITQLDPESSYISFEVLLETTKSEREIRDVFMFVETESILLIKPLRLSKNISFNTLTDKIKRSKTPIAMLGYDAVADLAECQIEETLNQVNPHSLKKSIEVSNSKPNSGGSSIRVSSERLDELMNLVSELVTTQASLSLFSGMNPSGELESISENIEKITRRLRDNAFTMSLIPVESLIVRFQRLVRDLSKDLNKEVILLTEGTETEIDKSIIEKLIDPMLHLMRNSLDHGIEEPEVREQKGKPRKGTIKLKAFYSGTNVIIEISDDGAGINPEKIRKKAISKGLISADAQMEEKEILNLIFTPGFSTAESLTGVSGRGVGMDVVRKNISEIRGEVTLHTVPEKGTTFTITLPLTLSIIDGLLVKIGKTNFILPLHSVEKCFEVPTKHLQNKFNDWITLDGQLTSFVFLRDKFNIRGQEPEHSQVIRISSGGQNLAFAVDSIIGEYQAVLKPLGMIYSGQDEFSGSTILGDGTVALVLDPNKLTKKTIYENNKNNY